MMEDGAPRQPRAGAVTVDDDSAWLVSQIQSLRHKLKAEKRLVLGVRMKYKAMAEGAPPAAADVPSILQQLIHDLKEQAFSIDESVEMLRTLVERIKGSSGVKTASTKPDDVVSRCLNFVHKFLQDALQLLADPSFFGSVRASNFFEQRLASTWKHVMGDSLPPDWAKAADLPDVDAATKPVLTQTIASQLARFLDICVTHIAAEAAKPSESEGLAHKDRQLAELASALNSLHRQHTAQLQQRDELIRHMQQATLEAATQQADWLVQRSEEQDRAWLDLQERHGEQYLSHCRALQQQLGHFTRHRLRVYKEKCDGAAAKSRTPAAPGPTEEADPFESLLPGVPHLQLGIMRRTSPSSGDLQEKSPGGPEPEEAPVRPQDRPPSARVPAHPADPLPALPHGPTSPLPNGGGAVVPSLAAMLAPVMRQNSVRKVGLSSHSSAVGAEERGLLIDGRLGEAAAGKKRPSQLQVESPAGSSDTRSKTLSDTLAKLAAVPVGLSVSANN